MSSWHNPFNAQIASLKMIWVEFLEKVVLSGNGLRSPRVKCIKEGFKSISPVGVGS